MRNKIIYILYISCVLIIPISILSRSFFNRLRKSILACISIAFNWSSTAGYRQGFKSETTSIESRVIANRLILLQLYYAEYPYGNPYHGLKIKKDDMYRFIFFYSLNQVGGIILEISVYFGNDRSERTECCCRTDKNRFRVNWGENIYIYIQSRVEKSLSVGNVSFRAIHRICCAN